MNIYVNKIKLINHRGISTSVFCRLFTTATMLKQNCPSTNDDKAWVPNPPTDIKGYNPVFVTTGIALENILLNK